MPPAKLSAKVANTANRMCAPVRAHCCLRGECKAARVRVGVGIWQAIALFQAGAGLQREIYDQAAKPLQRA